MALVASRMTSSLTDQPGPPPGTTPWRRFALCFLLTALGVGCRSSTPVTLSLEQRTTVPIGAVAILELPQDRRYLSPPGGAGGVTLVRRDGLRLRYRAVRLGPAVLVVSPDVADGQCISCATLHYFIDVVPQGRR